MEISCAIFYWPSNLRLTAIVFLFFTVSCYTISAQDAHRIFEHLTTDHGLSSNKVEAVLQDKEGYYWIATQNGLNRFDGTNFKVFRHNADDTTSLTHNNCTALAEDKNGDIWIATFKGVSRYQKAKGNFQRIYLSNPSRNFELTNRIYNLVTDGEGNIWITGNGLWKYDISTDQVSLYEGNINSPAPALKYQLIAHIAYDSVRNGHWFNTGYGVAFFNIATSQFFHEAFNPLHWKIFEAADNGELTLDTHNRVWFRDNQSQCLSYFDIEQNKVVITPKKAEFGIKQIKTDEKNRVWIFYWLIGAEIFDPVLFTTDTSFFSKQHRRSVLSEQATSLYVDHQHNYWISSSYGISIYREANQYYKLHEIKYSQGPMDKVPLYIKAITQYEHDFLWIATNRGLFRYNLVSGKNQFIPIDILNRNITTMLNVENRLWLGVHDQLICMDILSGKIISKTTLDPGIYFLRKGNDHDIWIGLWTGGVYRLNTVTGERHHYTKDPANPQALKSNSLITGFPDGDNFWVGYNAGIGFSRFTFSDEAWSHFHPQENSLANSNAGTITVITKDKANHFWLGSHGAGIFHFVPDKLQYTNYNQHHGLNSNYINSIIPDITGHLWISTADGVNYMNTDNHKIRTLDMDLVFPDNDFVSNGIEGLNGRIYFFCTNEVVEIDPSGYQADHSFPKLVLSNFSIFDKDQPLPDKRQPIDLSYRENFFSFAYSVIKTNPLKKATYAYILDGFDKDWNITERSFANYTNVPDGKYVFRIKVANDEGEWSEPMLTIPVYIKPPFWRTWWFVTMVVLFLMAAAYVFYQYRIQQIKKLFAVRTKISRDLHDDIGASLSSIHFNSSMARQEVEENPKKAKELLQQINQNSRQVIENISDIVWANNVGQKENSSLAGRIKNYGYDLLSPKNIDCVYLIDALAEKKLSNPEARRNVLLIIKEAMNNMAKYSEADRGEVSMAINGTHLHLNISDNGQGFDVTTSMMGNGLKNMKKRTDSLNGSFTIHSAPGKGTSILCRIPIPNISDT